jgi:hypothetical protein
MRPKDPQQEQSLSQSALVRLERGIFFVANTVKKEEKRTQQLIIY